MENIFFILIPVTAGAVFTATWTAIHAKKTNALYRERRAARLAARAAASTAH